MQPKARLTLQTVNENVVRILDKLERLDVTTQTTQQQVTALDGKVAILDGKVASLDGKVASLDGKVASLDSKVASLDSKVTSLDTRLAALDGRVAILETTVSRMAIHVARIPHIELRLSGIEAEIVSIRQRLDGLEGLYQHHDKKMEILDHEYLSMRVGLKRLEERFNEQEAEQLAERVRALEEKVATLAKNSLN